MLNAIYPIVEGDGEVAAVRILLERLAQEEFQNSQVVIFRPHRIRKGRMLSAADRSFEEEWGQSRLDSRHQHREAPELHQVGPRRQSVSLPTPRLFLGRARAARSDIFSSVVVAKAEYETWLLAAAHSLRGKSNIRDTAIAPPDPEGIRNAKGYIAQHLLKPGHHYSEIVDQPAMTTHFAFDEARQCPSFRKLLRDLTAAFAL